MAIAAGREGEGAEASNVAEVPARGPGSRAESSREMASSSTDAAGTASGRRPCDKTSGRNEESVEDSPSSHDPPDVFCVKDPTLLELLSDQRYWDEEASCLRVPTGNVGDGARGVAVGSWTWNGVVHAGVGRAQDVAGQASTSAVGTASRCAQDRRWPYIAIEKQA